MTVFAVDGTASRIEELPPSAKLVLKVLEYNGEMTQGEIAEEARLSKRTVRDALSRLRDEELIAKVPCLKDARKSFYEIEAGAVGSDKEKQKAKS